MSPTPTSENSQDTLKLPYADPVQCNEGMLLSPQHLQLDRVYWKAQLVYRVHAILADGQFPNNPR